MPVAKLKCKCGCKKYQLREKVAKYPYGNFFDKSHAEKWIEDKYKRDTAKKLIKFHQVVVKEKKAFNKETKRLKETIKKRTGPKGFYSNLATALHHYIKHVLRKGEPCYTCDKPQHFEDSGQAFHVGHFIPQKSVDPRRFMLMNLRMQCYKCNTHNSGMRAEYRQRLIEEIGIDKVEWLECDVNHKSLKDQYPEISNIKSEITKYRKLSND
tara:strand:+ start:13801 stop:14433 length:633 start_codon:yes stop_codon:yes gene_type:complete